MPRGQADGSVEVEVLLNYDSARKYWESFSSYMEMSTKQLERNLKASANRINEFEGQYNEISKNLKSLRQERLGVQLETEQFDEAQRKIIQLDQKIREVSNERNKLVTTFPRSNAENERLEALAKELEALKQQRIELKNDNKELSGSKQRYAELTQQIEDLKLQRKEAYVLLRDENGQFAVMNAKYVQMKKNNDDISQKAGKIEHHTRNIKNNTNKINGNLKSGIGHLSQGIKKILRMSLALVGIRSIYTGISSALNTWMNSEDKLAQQTKANLENLRMNVASLLQPALQSVINAFTNILALIGAVVKQFTKLNIFAKKTASSTGQMSKSASDTLASFDKIDVLKQDTDSGSGTGDVEPIDMTSLMEKYEKLAERIKEIFETIFDPIKKAWDVKGPEVIKTIQDSFEKLRGLGKSVGSSLLEVWTNGTGQKTVEHILGIFQNIVAVIGNIAEAWDKAWNKDDKGTKIIQNLADTFNFLLDIVERFFNVVKRVTETEAYQKFVDVLAKGIELVTQIVRDMAEAWDKAFSENEDEIVEQLTRSFEKLSEILEPIIEGISSFWEEHKDVFQEWASFLASTLPVMIEFFNVLLDILNLIVNPDWEHLETLGEDIVDLGEDSEKVDKKLAKFLHTLLQINEISQGGLGDWGIKGAVINMPEISAGGIEGLFDGTTLNEKTVKFVQLAKEKLGNAFDLLKKEIGTKVQLLTKEVETKWNFVTVILPQKIEEAKEKVKEKFDRIREEVERKIQLIKDTTERKFEEIRKTIVEKFENAKTEVTKKVEELKNKLEEKWEQIKSTIGEKVENIRNTIVTKFNNIKSTVEEKINGLKTNLANIWSNIQSTIGEKVENIRSTVVGKFETLKEDVGTKIENVKNTLYEKWKQITGGIGEKVNSAISAIKTPFENLGAGIGSALDTAWSIIREKLNMIIQGVENMINFVIHGINDLTANKVGGALTTGALGGLLSKFGVKIKTNGTNFRDVYLPRLAQGGIVTQATPALIGEAGREAVLPLEQNTEWMDALANKISEGLNVGINFTGSLSQLAQILKPEIDRENRRIGNNLVQGGIA